MSNAINDEEFTLLVHKFRDEPASILAFTPCIEKLIDSEHCRQIGALMHQNGAKWSDERLPTACTNLCLRFEVSTCLFGVPA